MRRHLSLLLSIGWLLLVFGVSFVVPMISDTNPRQPVSEPLLSPAQHPPLGTDALGRDVWTRIVHGGRISPSASLVSMVVTVLVGGIAGLIASSLGGWLDRVIVWLSNSLLAIPGLLLAMLLVAAMGPRLLTVILAVGFGGAPGFVRLSRTIFLQIREQNYVTASIALGANRTWIAGHHILPNAKNQLLSLATTHYAWAFMGTTTLTFLGLAGDPSIPEWGVMLNAGRAHLIDAPWLALWPGCAISLTILAVHRLGAWLSQMEKGE
jgi:peptide/nickel transport system permease protein